MESNPLFQPFSLQSLQTTPQAIQPIPVQPPIQRVRQFNVPRTQETLYHQPATAKGKGEERANERVGHILKTLPPNIKINSLVDIGAGNAEITDKIVKTLGLTEAYALDVYSANEFVKPSPYSIVQYKQIINDILPFPDNSIDMVTAFVSIHHIKDTITLFSEICRILKSGGFFFIREHDVTNDNVRIYLDQVHEQYEKNPHEHSVNPTYYWSRQNLSNYLIRHGFQKVADSDYDYQNNPQYLYHSLFKKISCSLTVYISDKSEDWRYVEDSFIVISPNVLFAKTWEEANVIWKPTPAGINPSTLPRLKYLNNLLTSAATLTEKGSLLQLGMALLGPSSTGFFSLVPFSFEYNQNVPLDVYLPESFQIGLPEYKVPGLGDKIWITKPAAGFSGQGIRLFNDRNLLIRSFQPDKRTIVQKYIENPLLIDGRKFDIRMYVLIAKGRILLYPDGFARLAPSPYSVNDLNISRHLTNISLHENKSQTVTVLNLDQINVTRESIYSFIKQLRPLFEYALLYEQQFKLTNNVQFETFELFGLDIMFDSTGKAWLLEINKNPGALSNIPSLIPDVLKEAIFIQSTKFFPL